MAGSRVKLTTIRLDLKLADEARRALGAKSRTEAVHMALREMARTKRYKALLARHAGKMRFERHAD